MLRINKKIIFIATLIVFICFISLVYLSNNIPSIKSAEQFALKTILKEAASDNKEHIYLLRTMLDEKKNLVWIEFYDSKSYLSSLWLEFVIVDLSTLKVIHTETDLQFYSGISPEMAASFRKYKTELHNNYGDFILVDDR